MSNAISPEEFRKAMAVDKSHKATKKIDRYNDRYVVENKNKPQFFNETKSTVKEIYTDKIRD